MDDEDVANFRLTREWAAPDTTRDGLSLIIQSGARSVHVRGRLAPTSREWRQIAKDIGDYIVVNDNEVATIVFSGCKFPAFTSAFPGWRALLEQLNRTISAKASSSWRIYFEGCTFASDADEDMAQDLRQIHTVCVKFFREVLTDFDPSERMRNRLEWTEIKWNDVSYNVDNYDDDSIRTFLKLWNVRPSSHQWQVIAAITADSTANGSHMDFDFDNVDFRHSVGLETFLATLAGMGVHPTTGTIRHHMVFNFTGCKFSHADALRLIGTAIASNKAVDTVDLIKTNQQPLREMVGLLSQSTTLRNIAFDFPRHSNDRDCICNCLAASTGLVSVAIRQYNEGDTDKCTEFVRDVRRSVTATAFKTRGNYRNWDTTPVKDLPYHCTYLQSGMPRVIVTAQRYFEGGRHNEFETESDDLYPLYCLTVLYDMLRPRPFLLEHVGNKGAAGERHCGKRKCR